MQHAPEFNDDWEAIHLILQVSKSFAKIVEGGDVCSVQKWDRAYVLPSEVSREAGGNLRKTLDLALL